MQPKAAAKYSTRRLTPAEQAGALDLVLREEFGVDFAFYDATTGLRILGGSDSGNPVDVSAVIASGSAEVRPAGVGRWRLMLPAFAGSQISLVAVAELPALSETSGAGERAAQPPERIRLQKWAQSVCDRLQMSDQLQSRARAEEQACEEVRSAWKVTLTVDRLIRGLRIHRQSPKHIHRVLQSAFDLLESESLFWAPVEHDDPVIVLGSSCLAPADCLQLAASLAADLQRLGDGPLFRHDEAERPCCKGHPQIRSLMAFAVGDSAAPLGSVVAINKKGSAGQPEVARFTRSDAAALTPFVALLQLQLRTGGRYQDLRDLLVGLTRSLTTAMDAKDPYTFGHSERVARIAVELAREMGLPPEEISDVYLIGLLHDVGNIGVNDAVLSKKTPLTASEFEHIKRHVTIGYTILADLKQIRNLLPGVLYHHERYDGAGYPDGLAGCAIPLVARIIAVADAYDAMSTSRPYRPAIPCGRIEEILQQEAGKQWDPQVIAAFFRCRHRIYSTRQRGVGESLRLALDGALGKGDGSVLAPEWESSNGQCPAFPAEATPVEGERPV